MHLKNHNSQWNKYTPTLNGHGFNDSAIPKGENSLIVVHPKIQQTLPSWPIRLEKIIELKYFSSCEIRNKFSKRNK